MENQEKRKTNICMHIEMGKKEKKERKEREEWMLRNGGLLLEKRISYFDGKYSNPMRCFSAEELQKATDNYHPNLFSRFGTSYRWYKGCLEGRVIFLKKYDDYSFKSTVVDPERVCNGIAVAAQVSGHKNALKLLGCCLETQLPTPVFEFPKNGCLCDQLVSNPTCLHWKIRLKIANEIASVITYLHTAFPRPIIHRDLRSQHFYLDQELRVKLSDFMLCMALPKGQTQVKNEPILGCRGFVAPEVAASGVYSEKSDVFSFGSLLLTLLPGKRYYGLSESLPSSDYGTSDIRNHRINKIFDHKILAEEGGVHHYHQFKAVCQLALECRRKNAEERPIMLDVARRLTRIQRYLLHFLLMG